MQEEKYSVQDLAEKKGDAAGACECKLSCCGRTTMLKDVKVQVHWWTVTHSGCVFRRHVTLLDQASLETANEPEARGRVLM